MFEFDCNQIFFGCLVVKVLYVFFSFLSASFDHEMVKLVVSSTSHVVAGVEVKAGEPSKCDPGFKTYLHLSQVIICQMLLFELCRYYCVN